MQIPRYEFVKTPEFEEWLGEQPLKAQLQVEDRLLHIAVDGHFGIRKRLTDEIWELKWANGRRESIMHIWKNIIFYCC